MRKKCKTCNCNSESDYCFRHKPRSPLPKIRKPLYKAKEGQSWEETLTEAINTISERNVFFLSIWQKRPHKSEISGEWLPQDLTGLPSSSAYFHHILEKNKYSEAEYDEDNIILLTLEEHDNVGIDCFRYPEINKRREELKKKYGI